MARPVKATPVVLLAALLATIFSSAGARARDPDETDVCVAASEQGQQLRDDGKYASAREAFARCARETCPSLVKHDCLQWLVDLDQRSPTIVLSARGETGDDLVAVHVFLDGAPIAEKLDGEPLRVDPGAHSVRYEAQGSAPVVAHVVIRAGEKNRILAVQFTDHARGPRVAGEALPDAAAERGQLQGGARARRTPLLAWAFGGLAAAGFASEAYFGISGMAQRSRDLAAGGCAPRCGSSEVGAIQTNFAIADVSLGVGVVSAGLAVYFFLRPGAPAPPVVVGFAPLTDGAAGSVGGRF